MNLNQYRNYFESLARKRIIGHNPEQLVNRFVFLRSSMKTLAASALDPSAPALMVYEPRKRTVVEAGMVRDYWDCQFEFFQPCAVEDEVQEIQVKALCESLAQKLYLKVLDDYHAAYQSGQSYPLGMPDPNSFSGQYFAHTGTDNDCGFEFRISFKADVTAYQPGYLVDGDDWEP